MYLLVTSLKYYYKLEVWTLRSEYRWQMKNIKGGLPQNISQQKFRKGSGLISFGLCKHISVNKENIFIKKEECQET